MTAISIAKQLADGLNELDIALNAGQQRRLLDYLDLLLKWNRIYNLSAIDDPQSGVARHLLDSLAVAPYIDGEQLLDVGSGGGLPAIPLAIAYPDRPFTLLDSNGKKSRFLVQAKGELRLDNLNVVHSRIETYDPGWRFDTILSRAFASLQDIIRLTGHLLGDEGIVMALKGRLDPAEIGAIPQGYKMTRTIALCIPGLEQEQRHLLIIGRDGGA